MNREEGFLYPTPHNTIQDIKEVIFLKKLFVIAIILLVLLLSACSSEQQASYILNKNTMKFHYTTCSSVNDIKEKNKENFYGSREEAVKRGYSPCGACNP